MFIICIYTYVDATQEDYWDPLLAYMLESHKMGWGEHVAIGTNHNYKMLWHTSIATSASVWFLPRNNVKTTSYEQPSDSGATNIYSTAHPHPSSTCIYHEQNTAALQVAQDVSIRIGDADLQCVHQQIAIKKFRQLFSIV